MVQSNAPWNKSGYGTQTDQLVPRLKSLGHEVSVFAFTGLEGNMLDVGYPVYPRGRDPYGNDVVENHFIQSGADILITLIDPWVLANYGKRFNYWYPIAPIDAHPPSGPTLNSLQGARRIIGLTIDGCRSLAQCGFRNIDYIPHGIDPKYFHPILPDPAQAKEMARLKMGFPTHEFIAVMVADNKSNPSRKAFIENIEAFAIFHERHPNSMFYIHTLPTTARGGIDLRVVVKTLTADYPRLEGAIWFPDIYEYFMGFTYEQQNLVYNAADVVIMSTKGEGAGLPTYEAQAAGRPVIVTNSHSVGESCFSGWKVPPSHREMTGHYNWFYVPSTQAIAQSLDEASLSDPVELQKMALEYIPFFYWDNVIKMWDKFLREVELERFGKLELLESS